MRGDVQLNKRQYVNISAATSTSGITVNTSTSPTSLLVLQEKGISTDTAITTGTSTTTATKVKGIKAKILGNIERV